MLVQLVVKNFKSIRDEQVLDFFSHKAKSQRNVVEFEGVPFKVYKVVVLIGANAAGKSTILDALNAIRLSILNKRFAPEQRVAYYEPHILDPETEKAPTCFEIEFVLPKTVNSRSPHYIYRLEYDEKEIIQEALYNISFKKRKATTCLYMRKKGDTDKTMKFSTLLSKGKKRIPFFINQTFLSAVRMTPDAVPELRAIAQYLCGELKLSPENSEVGLNSVSQLQLAKLFLPYADVGISDVRKKESVMEAWPFSEFGDLRTNEEFYKKLEKVLPEHDYYYFEHFGRNDYRAEIWFANESIGTTSFFELLPKLVDVLKSGTTWICDELGDELHPYLIMLIIQLFNDPAVNVNNAQILFTTHNMSILGQNLLSKEQIWLVEKRDGASSIYSLADFSGTNDIDLNKWYLDGRFGGIPAIDYYSFAKNMKKILLG